ncbi:MAG: AbrB/MazE/SpoVT family DNA-binding domain-containing protein [Pseudomonadota bacterium]
MRLTSKGQVTIPQSLRARTGLLPGVEVTFEEVEGGVRIRPAHGAEGGKQMPVLQRLRGSATVRMSTSEIMALTRKE